MEPTVLPKIGQLNNTSQKSTRQVLFSTLTTVIEMLKDRGHTNIQACQSMDEIAQNMTNFQHIVCGAGHSNVFVYFHNEERVGVKQLRTWLEASADYIIIVSLEGPTAFTRKEAETHNRVQFFLFKELCVNVTKHRLVPKHEKIQESFHQWQDPPYLVPG